MDRNTFNMDKSLIKLPVFRDTKFRAINSHEHICGLWVDRIGAARQYKTKIEKLRILGQFGAVAIEEGTGLLVTRNGRFSIDNNDVILIAPNDPCAYIPTDSWLTRWIVWNGSEAKTIFKEVFGKVKTCVLHNAAPAVLKAFVLLTSVISSESLAGALKRKAIILNLFYDFLDILENKNGYKDDSVRNKIIKIMEFIRENIQDHHSVPQLAKKTNMSVSHFRRMFSKYTGKSPLAFINTEKILRAKELLLKGGTIKEVAQQLGFEDVFYFMRLFKKNTGMTAGNFVRQHKNTF